MKSKALFVLSLILSVFSAKAVGEAINSAKDPEDFDRILLGKLK